MNKGIIFRVGIHTAWEPNSLGSAGQAVFPSASHIITTNKESAAGDSADNLSVMHGETMVALPQLQ